MPPVIGPLRHNLALERVSIARDEGGGAVETWSEVARVWGAVEATGGSLPFLADAHRARTTHRIMLRWRSDVSTADRLRLGTGPTSRLFRIATIADPDGRRRALTCACEEVT
jgi:SPP1 family predicted phage head-tail adaptor